MTASEVKGLMSEVARTGDLPKRVTQSTLGEMSKSLARYFDGAASSKIAEWAEMAKAAVEDALNVEERGGTEEGGTRATARGGLAEFLRASGAGEIGETMNLDFFLRVPMEVAQGAAAHLARNWDQDRVDAYPALELRRVYPRIVPRGSERDPAGPENGWDDEDGRWQAACDEAGDDDAARVFDDTGRMVALKDSGVWDALGDGAGGYDDTLGNGFAPFAFNSGMDCDEVPYAECVALGLLDDGDEAEPADIDVEDLFDMEARAARAAGALEAAAWSEEDHPRDRDGRFASGGGAGAIDQMAFPPIHGKSVMSVVRRMARDGFKPDEIKRVMNSYGTPLSTTSIKMAYGKFEQGKEVAELTPEQMADLRRRATSDAPEPPKPERPPRPPKAEGPPRERPPKADAPEPEPAGDFGNHPAPASREDAVRNMMSKVRYHDASPKDAEKFNATVSEATRNFSEKALGRLKENVSSIRYAPKGPEFERQYSSPGSANALAFYNRATRKICSSEAGDHDSMAHEMAHAVDRDTGGASYKYSGSDAWSKAWESDKRTNAAARGNEYDRPGRADYASHDKLWRYGFTNHQEGFAVSVETAHSHGYAVLQRKAPRMAKLLKDWDLIKTT